MSRSGSHRFDATGIYAAGLHVTSLCLLALRFCLALVIVISALIQLRVTAAPPPAPPLGARL